MMRAAILAALGLSMLAVSATANTGAGIGTVVADRSPTAVDPGLYYTRVEVTVPKLTLPPTGEKERKRLGRAILEAFKITKETRSITVSIAASPSTSPTMIEHPLITFTFDKNQALVDSDTVSTVNFPLAHLAPSETYSIRLKYRDSEKNEFDLNEGANGLLKLVPGSTLITTATQPFIQNIGSVASSIFTIMGSRAVAVSRKDELTPYRQASGDRGYTYPLIAHGDVPLATVVVKLAVAPTLARTPTTLTGRSEADFRLLAGEDPAVLSLITGGLSKRLATETQGLQSYAQMARERSAATVQAFCRDARALLNSQFSLTRMDRALVMHQALLEAGFTESSNAWYFACFTDDEKIGLKLAFGREPAPSGTSVGGFVSTLMPSNLKWAIGCFITGKVGPQCAANAPDPRRMLSDALADHVALAPVEMSNIDTSALPDTKLVGKAELLDMLAGKAEDFLCFSHGSGHGLLLATGSKQKIFYLSARREAEMITALAIESVPAGSATCAR